MGLFGPKVLDVNGEQLQDLLRSQTPPYILDVRTPGEFHEGHIPQAELIPLNELGHRLHEVPRDRPVVTVCRSGARSHTAARHLVQAGFDVKNLQGGMLRWSGPIHR
ncbi:MAG: rhodanese-like domain-containing protein [Thermaerobacter sp.]|nr:rhodanese-like domain-containing protein [Thermaerobacter sp.]